MTDETKQLFGAPWAVDEKTSETFGEVFDVMEEDLYLHYARCYDEKTANRLARLPELYDALLDKVADTCLECHHESCRPFPGKDRLAEIGCPFKDKPCQTAKHLDLLRKVRGGE